MAEVKKIIIKNPLNSALWGDIVQCNALDCIFMMFLCEPRVHAQQVSITKWLF